MLSFIVAVLTSVTLFITNLFVDGDRDPRNFLLGQEQFEQPHDSGDGSK
jgi:hypothetical protein